MSIDTDLRARIEQLAEIAGATPDARRTTNAPAVSQLGRTYTGMPWWVQEGFFAATNYGATCFRGPQDAPSATNRAEWYVGARLGRATLSRPYRRAQRRVKLMNRAFLAGMAAP